MSLQILVFEPEEDDFRALQKALRDSSSSGAEPKLVLRRASSREEFRELFKSSSPDAIVVDSGRNEGVEIEALMWARNTASKAGRVPVIVVTEPRGDQAAVRAIKAGASDYVLMTELERLGSAVRAAVKERKTTEEQARSLRDLRQAAEQIRESQKLVTIGRLSGMITHEINNPLAAISNLLYLLRQEDRLSGTGIDYLELAEREMERVIQISRQTLSFYRESSAPERQKPQDLVEEVLALYRRHLMEKRICVRRRYDFSGTVVLYPGEMRQVLSNLVVNAIESMQPDGALTVHVYETRRWSEPGAFRAQGARGIRIVIADTGSGISAEKLHHIGEPFFTTKGQKGTGLGLWVSQGILRKYGGDLQVSSSTSPGRHGTVFSIFVPTEMGPRAQSRGSGSEEPYNPRYGARGRGPMQSANA